jgi:hypothetical protein
MRRWILVSTVTAMLVLSGCTPEPAPEVDPSEAASPSVSGEPSAEPSGPADEPIALPDCDTIYSPPVVATLTSEGRSPLGDVSAPGMGGWGTNDPAAERILAALDERISCTWILPATESGSTTSIARLDDASRVSLVTALTTAGFVVAGDRFTIEVETEVGSYNETHVLTDEFWIGTFFSGGDSALLTDDAAAQLLP